MLYENQYKSKSQCVINLSPSTTQSWMEKPRPWASCFTSLDRKTSRPAGFNGTAQYSLRTPSPPGPGLLCSPTGKKPKLSASGWFSGTQLPTYHPYHPTFFSLQQTAPQVLMVSSFLEPLGSPDYAHPLHMPISLSPPPHDFPSCISAS